MIRKVPRPISERMAEFAQNDGFFVAVKRRDELVNWNKGYHRGFNRQRFVELLLKVLWFR